MRGKLLGFMLAVVSVATIGIVQMDAKAEYIDNTPDCDKYSVVNCGTFSESAIRASFNTDDHAAVFGAFGISSAAINGMQEGVVYQNGTVQVAGKTVATNAVMAARYLGGSAIAGSSTAKKVSVSAMGSAQTALVKFDANGKFLFAIMKPCGNPVTGTPTYVPPKPKPAAACTALDLTMKSRTVAHFSVRATATNGATISGYIFNIYNTQGQLVEQKSVNTAATSAAYDYSRTTPGTYTVRAYVKTSLGNLTSAACQKNMTVAPAPTAECKAASVETLSRTSFKLNGSATVGGGATISSYVFKIYKDSTLVDTKTVSASGASASTTYTQTTPGNYKVVLTVKTSLGDKTSSSCEAAFSVKQPDVPGVSINKLVDGVDYKKVDVNVEFTYQIKVTNTGNTDLKNVAVSDTPEAGVTLILASNGTVKDNTWNYTISELKVGQSMDFTITGRVPEYKAGIINNTACVDAPQVPGSPDDCDDAGVEVPPSTPPVETPPELPKTGAADVVAKLAGVVSLAGATAYYVTSRRNN